MTQEVRNRIAEMMIVVVSLVGAWYLLAEPMHRKAQDARAEVASLEAEIARFESSSTLADAEARKFERRIESLLSVAAPRPALERHEGVLELARAHALEIERINPKRKTSSVTYGPFTLEERFLQIEARGTFADAAAFLSELGDTPMVVIEHFALGTGRSDASVVSLSASIRTVGLTASRRGLAEVEP